MALCVVQPVQDVCEPAVVIKIVIISYASIVLLADNS